MFVRIHRPPHLLSDPEVERLRQALDDAEGRVIRREYQGAVV
jgi:hypothetical protein